ncbi:hypothetical protein FRC01_010455, partial [Tulasnella sp. 417]
MLPSPATSYSKRHSSRGRSNDGLLADALTRFHINRATLLARSRVTNLGIALLSLILGLSLLFNLNFALRPVDPHWGKAQSWLSAVSKGAFSPGSITGTIVRQPQWTEVRHLIIVAGHAVWTGSDPNARLDESNWILEDRQRGGGNVAAFYRHIEEGARLVNSDAHALLVFSGGQTRPTSLITEAQSYHQLAVASKLLVSEGHHASTLSPALRTTAENFALDSFQNLLFSLARFHEVTGSYPTNITVVGFGMKKPRFQELHRKAIRWPEDRFRYIGIDVEGDTSLAYAGESEFGYGPYSKDLSSAPLSGSPEQNRRLHHASGDTVGIELLPPEILESILLLTFDPWEWLPTHSANLALVSRTWHYIVISSNLFWPRISNQQRIEVSQQVLKLNDKGNIVVEVDERTTLGSDAQAFLALARPQIHRWNTLFFYGYYQEELFSAVGTEGLKIENLFVDVYPGGPPRRAISLGEGPPLRHLALFSASLNWNTDRLRSLRSITLASIRSGPTLAELYTFLSSSKMLEVLYLDDVGTADSLGPEPASSVIHLPFLTDIWIGDLPTRLFHFLVENVRTPISTSVCLDAITSPSISMRALDLALPSLRSSSIVDVEYSELDHFACITSDPTPQPLSSYGGLRIPGANITVKHIKLEYILLRLSEIPLDRSVERVVNLHVVGQDETSQTDLASKEFELRQLHLLQP